MSCASVSSLEAGKEAVSPGKLLERGGAWSGLEQPWAGPHAGPAPSHFAAPDALMVGGAFSAYGRRRSRSDPRTSFSVGISFARARVAEVRTVEPFAQICSVCNLFSDSFEVLHRSRLLTLKYFGVYFFRVQVISMYSQHSYYPFSCLYVYIILSSNLSVF